MYILFREKNWRPSDYFSMGEGEKIVVQSFIDKFVEERKKEAETIGKAAEKARRGRRSRRR